MWPEFFGRQSSGKSTLGHFHFILGFVFENFLEHLDDILLVIDDEDARLPGHQSVERHSVLLHETDELVERDAPVF